MAAVRVVDSFADGLAEANRGEYGLAAVVLTPSHANAQRAWRELEVGTVKVNAVFGGAPGGAAEPLPVLGPRLRLRAGAARRGDAHEGRAPRGRPPAAVRRDPGAA